MHHYVLLWLFILQLQSIVLQPGVSVMDANGSKNASKRTGDAKHPTRASYYSEKQSKQQGAVKIIDE